MQTNPLIALISLCKRAMLACICGCSLGLVSADAETKSFANSPNTISSERVTILIRTIQATSPVVTNQSETPATSTDIEPSLIDLQAKLTQLPFRSFKLVASKEGHFELTKKGTLNLPNGQSVALRPMYADNLRMGMWLNWLDSDGTEILNTRIHFDSEDTIVTGTDSASDEGLLLAITASQKAVP
jgi:hypothetical protein